jgi:hypothetical protein
VAAGDAWPAGVCVRVSACLPAYACAYISSCAGGSAMKNSKKMAYAVLWGEDTCGQLGMRGLQVCVCVCVCDIGDACVRARARM